jgi:hypothetical protein
LSEKKYFFVRKKKLLNFVFLRQKTKFLTYKNVVFLRYLSIWVISRKFIEIGFFSSTINGTVFHYISYRYSSASPIVFRHSHEKKHFDIKKYSNFVFFLIFRMYILSLHLLQFMENQRNLLKLMKVKN